MDGVYDNNACKTIIYMSHKDYSNIMQLKGHLNVCNIPNLSKRHLDRQSMSHSASKEWRIL